MVEDVESFLKKVTSKGLDDGTRRALQGWATLGARGWEDAGCLFLFLSFFASSGAMPWT